MKRIKNIYTAICFLISSFLIFVAGSCQKEAKTYSFETAAVKKGSIINTITATGTIEADTTVSIGTQVSGVVKKIYVDFNSIVKKGQLLAEIDKTPLQSQVQQGQASLDDSKSEVEFQSANYERYKDLIGKKLVAQADFDQVKYNYNKALANLKTAQAGYDKAIVNLKYASIYSPISGVVLNRAVDQGQTVAASFNTPNLFTIGNDLTHMQVMTNVDEADIGLVKQGQPVEFNVDAYPMEIFKGDVRQIRLQPVVTSNVVTYTVIVSAPNPEKKLMPGMTANITVLVQKVDSVPVIPGKALRFTPEGAYMSGDMKKIQTEDSQEPKDNFNYAGTRSQINTGESGQLNNRQFQSGTLPLKRPAVVWIKTGDRIQQIHIVTGAADGINSEVKSGLKEGDEVILSMYQTLKTRTSAANSNATSPFIPQRPLQGGRGRGY